MGFIIELKIQLPLKPKNQSKVIPKLINNIAGNVVPSWVIGVCSNELIVSERFWIPISVNISFTTTDNMLVITTGVIEEKLCCTSLGILCLFWIGFFLFEKIFNNEQVTLEHNIEKNIPDVPKELMSSEESIGGEKMKKVKIEPKI